jgi:hypothetical protein
MRATPGKDVAEVQDRDSGTGVPHVMRQAGWLGPRPGHRGRPVDHAKASERRGMLPPHSVRCG